MDDSGFVVILQRILLEANVLLVLAGLLYYEGESDYDSINPALNAAMLFARYAPMASSDEVRDKFEEFADSQLTYVLGRNPMSGQAALESSFA